MRLSKLKTFAKCNTLTCCVIFFAAKPGQLTESTPLAAWDFSLRIMLLLKLTSFELSNLFFVRAAVVSPSNKEIRIWKKGLQVVSFYTLRSQKDDAAHIGILQEL